MLFVFYYLKKVVGLKLVGKCNCFCGVENSGCEIVVFVFVK